MKFFFIILMFHEKVVMIFKVTEHFPFYDKLKKLKEIYSLKNLWELATHILMIDLEFELCLYFMCCIQPFELSHKSICY